MVRYRPDPRGCDFNQLFKWQSTLGPFKSVGFKYSYYKFFDHALKHPAIAFPATVLFTCVPFVLYAFYRSYATGGTGNARYAQTAEKLFMYAQSATDRRKTRGEWDNNNYCWRDSPDCGKDFPPRYSS